MSNSRKTIYFERLYVLLHIKQIDILILLDNKSSLSTPSLIRWFILTSESLKRSETLDLMLNSKWWNLPQQWHYWHQHYLQQGRWCLSYSLNETWYRFTKIYWRTTGMHLVSSQSTSIEYIVMLLLQASCLYDDVWQEYYGDYFNLLGQIYYHFVKNHILAFAHDL